MTGIATWTKAGGLEPLVVDAFNERIHYHFVASAAGFRKVCQTKAALVPRCGDDSVVSSLRVAGGSIASVTFVAAHSSSLVRREMPFEVAVADADRLRNLGVTTNTLACVV